VSRADLFGGLILALFFGAALWEATTFQYGTEFSPGPGFAPVWLSAVGLFISLLILAYGIWAWRNPERFDKPPGRLDRPGLLRVALTLVSLGAMVLLVPALGLVLAILAFLLFLTLIVQRHSFLIGIGASVGTVAFVWLVFVYFLDVPIPKGPLGI
jgi:putative tricarboxylic transport membrane protein